MSANKSIDKICVIALILSLIAGVLFCNGKALGIEAAAHTIGYENRLFDNSKVHSFDIVIDDWDAFLETCESEVYTNCNVVIDGEAVKNVGIRGKGNTSLSSVKNSGSSRYSFKIEFDQYDSTKSYHGLDKLCLNNVIQDNTYMKDYLAYTLMYNFGVDAPLCSFVYITVNGEDWGLYLAVEAVEESFLQRNYGNDYGELYKPDSLSFGGGGPGNGKDFNMSDFMKNFETDGESTDQAEGTEKADNANSGFSMPDFGGNMPDFANGEMPDFANMKKPDSTDESSSGSSDKSSRGKGGFGGMGGGFGGFGMGSSDVKLQYSDDDTDSYSNIFGNAKTDVSTADKNRLIRSLKALSEQSDLENTVDIDEVIRYFVVHTFLCNGDSYTGQMIHNYYLYEKDGRLAMIPWDYNLAFGTFQGSDVSGTVNSPIDTPVSGGMSDRPMISWIFDNAEYTEMYHQLYSEFINSVDLAGLIDDTVAMIDSYVQKDPTKFCTYEDFQKGTAALRSFCTLRAESVSGQLAGTIPSTKEGQREDSSALIDTGDLVISDMGSMGGGNVGGFGGFGRGGDSKGSGPSGSRRGEKTSESDTDATSGGSETSAVSKMSQSFGGSMPEGFDPSQMPGGGNMPSGMTPPGSSPETSGNSGSADQTDETKKTEQSDNNGAPESNRPQMSGFPSMSGGSGSTDGFILLGVSVLCLIAGIIVAAIYKR